MPKRKPARKKSAKKSDAYFKKGKASTKTIDGKKHVWRKGYTRKDGSRVRGMWVRPAKKARRKTRRRRK